MTTNDKISKINFFSKADLYECTKKIEKYRILVHKNKEGVYGRIDDDLIKNSSIPFLYTFKTISSSVRNKHSWRCVEIEFEIPTFKYKNKSWTDDEERILKTFYQDKNLISLIPDKNVKQIRNKAFRLGLSLKIKAPRSSKYIQEGNVIFKKKTKYIYTNGEYQPLAKVLMEEKLGRDLLQSELVVFKDGNKNNLEINNLEVVTKSEWILLVNAKRRKTID